ncbi:xaa-Pro aminopeptidase 3-like isoform X2 [Oratosquilla oratoria]|uniref:xaa-Pro aminopeptidase 3-like isoform X2 n=1 Tax=Oratosquilla oratoria TaxID=337810 RepID=UPI003F776B5C
MVDLLIKRLCHSAQRVGQHSSQRHNESRFEIARQSKLSHHKASIQPKNLPQQHILRVGQPTSHTHPHLVGRGEITYGITREEYALRRLRLIEAISKVPHHNDEHHVIILAGVPRRYMIDKIPYLFRQDTDMLYLSGCQETDCVLVMHTLPGKQRPTHKSIMFTPTFDPGQEMWDGPRTGPCGAVDVWGVDEGLPITDLYRYLTALDSDLLSPKLWYHFQAPTHPEVHKRLHNWLQERQGSVESPKGFIHALRVIKSEAEVELMRRTCRISGESIAATMKATRAPISEHELFAKVDFECRTRGAEHLAYPPVVAGGTRANIIHYINNNQIVEPGELVLMDAGSECGGYSGDVTRTWPVSGSFKAAQRDVYEAVLDVQQHIINALNDRPTLDQLFAIMCEQLGKNLQELCILPSSFSDSQLSRAAYGFCPHHVSHYLGMDVHDTPLLPRKGSIPAHAVVTVEPGIYISQTHTGVPSRYLGVGVRLEDDVLITDSGVEVLSSSCPSHPDDVEEIVGADFK